MTASGARRADAERNRARILSSARRVYREAGPDASLDRIASEAGVGNATLYRHFPDRTTLRTAVLVERMLEVEAFLADLDPAADPWAAVAAYVRFLAAVPDNTLVDVLVTPPVATPELQALRERIRARVDVLLAAAVDAGTLRSGYTVDAMNVFLFAHAKAATSPLIRPEAAAVLVEDHLRGIRAGS